MKTLPDIDDDLLAFLQWYFGTERITPAGKGANKFLWTPDPKNTPLEIRAKDVTNAESIGKKPILIVDRGSAQLLQNSLKNKAWQEITSDTETMLELLYCNYVIHCISQNDYESNILATMVQGAFWIHRDEFRPLGYHKIRVDRIGSPSIILNDGEEVEAYDTPVGMTIVVNVHFTIAKNRPIVTDYTLDGDGMLIRDIEVDS